MIAVVIVCYFFVIGNTDPVRAERFQDGMMRSREKMQRKLDEEARLFAEKQEEVRTTSIPYIIIHFGL